ncbi:MAG: tetratricopeptide repeat protein [Gammaproteobacteria bacterium]
MTRPVMKRDVLTLLRSAIALHRSGSLDAAASVYLEALQKDPDCFDALNLLGAAELQRGNLTAALSWLDRAVRMVPSSADAQANRAGVLRELGRSAEALECLNKAITADAFHVGALTNRAAVLLDQSEAPAALESVTRALALDPDHPPALFNQMSALRALGRIGEALTVCEKALRLVPSHPELLSHHAALLRSSGRPRDALAACNRALRLNPADAVTQANRAHALSELGQLSEAVASYRRAYALNSHLPYLAGWLLHSRLLIADWDELDELRTRIATGIDAGEPVCEPFVSLFATDDRQRLQRCANIYAQHQWGSVRSALAASFNLPVQRIRVGYFSADFHEHPVAQLCVGAIEHHDRSRFEVVGFELGPPVADSMRERLRKGFDRFINLDDCSDAQAAELVQRFGIDIAVDLGGYTRRSRTGIFAHRAAPLQVSWLGFAGTLGAPFIDYLFADGVVTPDEHAANYSETIVRLPHCYQPNDDQRGIDERVPSREELGLPAESFVFCCFNNQAKITPEAFALWMRILRRVPGAVLWLLEQGAATTQALRRHAQSHGIDPARLVFAPRSPPAEHLARHRAADLFLDTWPYNAHTTASDALWAGLPVLTCPGESFGSRVASSLLLAVGLPELIADSSASYEQYAVMLASDRGRLDAIRRHLGVSRTDHALFDTAHFTTGLMTAYEVIWQRHCDGRPAAPLDLSRV